MGFFSKAPSGRFDGGDVVTLVGPEAYFHGVLTVRGSLRVEREIEGGSYTIETTLPALFTIQKGINSPRYPTLPNIMKAKKKEIKELSLADLGLSADELASGLEVEKMSLPRQDRLNKILDGDTPERVRQLLSVLREEEKVL